MKREWHIKHTQKHKETNGRQNIALARPSQSSSTNSSRRHPSTSCPSAAGVSWRCCWICHSSGHAPPCLRRWNWSRPRQSYCQLSTMVTWWWQEINVVNWENRPEICWFHDISCNYTNELWAQINWDTNPVQPTRNDFMNQGKERRNFIKLADSKFPFDPKNPPAATAQVSSFLTLATSAGLELGRAQWFPFCFICVFLTWLLQSCIAHSWRTHPWIFLALRWSGSIANDVMPKAGNRKQLGSRAVEQMANMFLAC